MKKITDLITTTFTSKETKNSLGQLTREKVPIQIKRKVNALHIGARFAHFIIDVIVITAIMYLLQYAGLFSRSTPFVWVNCCDGSGGFEFNYAGYLVVLAYYAVLEGTLGRTIGKFVTNSFVIDDYGKKPAISAILLRTICRAIPIEPLSCFGERGWHDKWSKTYVVHKNELKALKKGLAEVE